MSMTGHQAKRSRATSSGHDDGNTILAAAIQYHQKGLMPLPVPFRSKAPVLPKWQRFHVEEADLHRYFNGQPQNIGLLLGKPSNGLVDIDLDCVEAIALADHTLAEDRRRVRPKKQTSITPIVHFDPVPQDQAI